MNIYPAEVDAVLLGHPAVADVATIGVPDDEWGESVLAVVEPRRASSATLPRSCWPSAASGWRLQVPAGRRLRRPPAPRRERQALQATPTRPLPFLVVKTRMTRAQRREHFLDVAAALVVDSGLESVTMERVASRAGVSKALGYAYFDNSDELLASLFDREMASLRPGDRRPSSAPTTFEDKMRATVVAMFDMLAERGQLFGTLLNGDTPRRARRSATASAAASRRPRTFIGELVTDEFGIPPEQAVTWRRSGWPPPTAPSSRGSPAGARAAS